MEVTALIDSQVLHPCLSLCTLCVAGPPCANAPYAACFQSCACLTAISFCSHLFIFVMLDCVAHVKLAMAFVRSFQRFKSMFAYTCVCVRRFCLLAGAACAGLVRSISRSFFRVCVLILMIDANIRQVTCPVTCPSTLQVDATAHSHGAHARANTPPFFGRRAAAFSCGAIPLMQRHSNHVYGASPSLHLEQNR